MKEEYAVITDSQLYSLAGRVASALELLKKTYQITAVTTMCDSTVSSRYQAIIFYSLK